MKLLRPPLYLRLLRISYSYDLKVISDPIFDNDTWSYQVKPICRWVHWFGIKIFKTKIKMPKQVNVLSWVDENVPIKDRNQFRVEMIKWDKSLEKLPIAYWPSYDEDVLKIALKYSQE